MRYRINRVCRDRGKYTYQDNISKEKMAEVCMENYDTEFGKIAKAGDILVTGFNFGCVRPIQYNPLRLLDSKF